MCTFVIQKLERYKCKIMINRINLILRAKNITARQFAEEIGIQPSGMSHILGGRNNPSLDFVTKVIRRYPEIDANWLLLGRGEMYTAGAGSSPVGNEVKDIEANEPANLFSAVVEPEAEPEPTPVPVSKPYNHEDTAEETEKPVVGEPGDYRPAYIAVPPEAAPSSVADRGRRLVRMLFIYSDNTFSEFLPAE